MERHRTLMADGAACLATDRMRAADIAREALALAESIGSSRHVVEALHLLADALRGLGSYDEEAAVLDRGRSLIDVDPSLTDLLPGQLRRLALNSHARSDYPTAQAAYEQALEVVDDNVTERARLLSGLGNLLSVTGDYARAFEVLLEALRIWTDAGHLNGVGLTNNHLGALHLTLEEWEMALEYYERSLAINRELGNLAGEATVLTNMGGVYMEQGDLEKGLSCQLMALAINRKLGSRHNIGVGLCGIAIAYGRLGRIDRARQYNLAALGIQRSIGNTSGVAHTLFCLAEIELEEGNVRLAADYVQEAKELFKRTSFHDGAWFAHKMSARLSEIQGDTAEALHHYKLYMEAREEMQNQELRRHMTQVQVRIEVLRAEKDRELFRLRAEQLEQEMAHRTEQLAQQALHVARLSQIVGDLRSDLLPSLSYGDQGVKEMARKFLNRLDEHGPAASWQSFEERFIGSHPEFFGTLAREYPSLSRTELKVCALLRIKLSTKEIADVLSTSVRTIDNHRRHIRQKMSIANEINLSTHLARF